MDNTSLQARMQGYEEAVKIYLPRRFPYIVRLDGRAFHTYTKHFEKPWSKVLAQTMLHTAKQLCKQITGAKIAYWQSDEISILVTDYDTLKSQAWFDKNVQKTVSVSASIAASTFNELIDRDLREFYKCSLATFDSRAFILPKEEVCNYFLFRQNDASNNSINMLGQSQFSPEFLHGLSTNQIQEELFSKKGLNWNNLETWKKRGACVLKKDGDWAIDLEIPLFSSDKNYINQYVYVGEEQ